MKTVILICVVIVTAAAVGLSEEYRYDARGKRDPFIPLIGIDKPAVAKLEDVTSVDEILLEGIALEAKAKRTAMINGRMLKEGDKVGDVEVNKITEKTVTLSISGKSYDIKLSEKGGSKGG